MKLTNVEIKAAKPRDKPYKMADSGGLYLLVNPKGSNYWRLKYRFAGKENTLAIGTLSQVTLAEARPEFFDRLDAYNGNVATILGLRLLVLTLLRPGEVRKARWEVQNRFIVSVLSGGYPANT